MANARPMLFTFNPSPPPPMLLLLLLLQFPAHSVLIENKANRPLLLPIDLPSVASIFIVINCCLKSLLLYIQLHAVLSAPFDP